MITRLLLFRAKQGLRAIRHIGIGFLLFFLVITLGITLQIAEGLLALPAIALLLIGAGCIASIHYKRKDLLFLQSICNTSQQMYRVLCAEYFVISLLFIIYFCITKNYVIAAVTFALPLIAFLPVKTLAPQTDTKQTLSFLPLSAFELKPVLRKTSGYISCFGY